MPNFNEIVKLTGCLPLTEVFAFAVNNKETVDKRKKYTDF